MPHKHQMIHLFESINKFQSIYETKKISSYMFYVSNIRYSFLHSDNQMLYLFNLEEESNNADIRNKNKGEHKKIIR